MQIYCLFDRVAQKHLPMWQAENTATAQRALTGALAQDPQLSKNHQDYDVIHLGNYDLTTGVITPERTHLCTLTTCFAPEALV